MKYTLDLLENGKTYTAYLQEVGQTLGLHPVYLAAKIRQEQGTAGTSAIISGRCGSLLADYYRNQTQTSESGKQILPPSSGYTEEDLKAFEAGTYEAGSSKLLQKMEAAFGPLDDRKN